MFRFFCYLLDFSLMALTVVGAVYLVAGHFAV